MEKNLQLWYESLGLIIFDTIDSTQAEAHRLALSNAKGNFIICAKSQTSGRGRHGRTWISEEGGVYYSLLLQDNIESYKPTELGFVIGNALYDTIKFFLPANQDCTLKWPNDLVVLGQKIAGILVEHKQNHLNKNYYAVGVGINLTTYPEDIDQKATSLLMVGGKKTSFEDVIDYLSSKIVFWLDIYAKLGFKRIIDSWVKKSFSVGIPLSTTHNGSKIQGIYKGVERETGALILLVKGEKIIINSGEIYLE